MGSCCIAIEADDGSTYLGEIVRFLRAPEAAEAGYLFEGTLRSTKVIRESRVDSMMYSMLPGDP